MLVDRPRYTRVVKVGWYRWIDESEGEAKSSELAEIDGRPVISPAVDVFAYPADYLDRLTTQQSRRKQVCVIGAGIAGLSCAHELLARPAGSEKHSVVVVEADQRAGGRIRTWHTQGVSGEFGPMRVPVNHGGTLHYIKKFGLRVGIFVQRNPNAFYRTRYSRRRLGEWLDLADEYCMKRDGTPWTSPRPTSDSAQRALDELLGTQATQALSGQSWQLLCEALSPSARALASLSLAEFIIERAVRVRELPGRGQRTDFPLRRVLTDAEWQFIGRLTGMYWDGSASALEGFVEEQGILGGEERRRLVDGMDQLPHALLRSIREDGGRVVLGAYVDTVARDPDGRMRVFANRAEIRSPDGRGFDYVVCAVPAPASAQIHFDPPLSPRKIEALQTLKYQSAAKSLVLVKQRRWEMSRYTDGRPIVGGASYTHHMIQQCWYPSDNVEAIHHVPDGGSESVVLRCEEGGVPAVSGPGPLFSAIEYVVGRRGGPSRAGVLTGAYMTGMNAERFTSLDSRQRDALVLEGLEELHPGIRNDVLDIQHWSWLQSATPGGGAWTIFLPGDHDRLQGALCASHPAEESRVFFAGEHLCVLHGWMQSAIQSALVATAEVLSSA